MKNQYKALLIILILVLVELFKVYSQTYPNSITTSSDESGSSPQRIARDNVTLLPGFKFIPTSTTQWLGKTDENIVNDVQYTTANPHPSVRPLDTSLPVGTIDGSFGVSLSGGASYQVPIIIPIGTAGVQPSISIVYNSQSGNGVLGLGWNISGLSAISRTPNNKFFDGYYSGLDYSYNDKFSIDGMRLLINTGDYGYANSTYKKELYDFSSITYLGDNAGFDVVTKDGTHIEYGTSNDSRLVPKQENGSQNGTLIWYIKSITDRLGNYMTFTYELDSQNGECDIKEISYTGNSNSPALDPYNKVVFLYDNRTDDDNIYFIGGNSIKSSKLLRKIRIESSGETVKNYLFNYISDNNTNITDTYTKLYSIDEYGKNNDKLNSTNTYYGNFDNVSFEEDLVTETAGPYSSYPSYITPINFNGDWSVDVVVNYGLNLYLYDNSTLVSTISNPYNLIPYRDIRSLNDNYTEYVSHDFNGDGVDDLLMYSVHSNMGYVYSLDKIVIYYGNKDNALAFQSPVDYSSLIPVNHYFSHTNLNISNNWALNNVIMVKDFDGDGNMDFMLNLANYSLNQFKSYIYYPSISVNCYEVNSFSTLDLLNASNVKTTDFNHDNINDITTTNGSSLKVFQFHNNGTTVDPTVIYSSTAFGANKLYEGDFNGDGNLDFLQYITSSSYKIYYSTGNNYNTTNAFTTPLNSYLVAGDYNGDGITDLLFISSNLHDISVYYFTGYEKYIVKTYIQSDVVLSTDKKILRSDFNGDGITDLLCKTNTNTMVHLYFNRNKKDLFLTEIIDGVGKKLQITYNPLSGNYTPKADYYINDDKSYFQYYPRCVVTKTAVSDGGTTNELGESLTFNEYSYKYAMYYEDKKAFAGFMNTEIVSYFKPNPSDQIQFTKDINYVDYSDYGYSGLLPLGNSTMYNGNNNKASQVIYGFNNSFGTHCSFAYPASSYKRDYLTNVCTNTTYTYNTDGNLETQTTDYGTFVPQPYSFTGQINSVATYTYDYAGLSYRHKLATSNIETKYLSEVPLLDPFTQTESFDYLSNGALSHHYKNDVTTTYEEYNNFGSPQKVTVSSTGLQNKISRFEYDNTGRFATKETNPATHFITSEYDPIMCTKTHVTDINGHSTSYEYDNFGNLKRTISPENIESNISSQFISDPLIPNALYFSEATATNSPFVRAYYDKLGREILTETNDFNNHFVKTYTTYNKISQVVEKSEPYFDGETPLKTTYTYYNDGRLENVNTFGVSTTNYQYNNLTTIVTNNATLQSFTKTTNAAGQIVTATDAGGAVSYTYYSSGLPHTITSNGATTTMEYDTYGRQSLLIDPDAGTTEYHYNAYGELEYQVDNKGNRYDNMLYDALGRLLSKTGPEGDYSYTYDSDPNNKGTLSLETAPGGISTSYFYDNLGRISKTTQNIQEHYFDFSFKYDNFGNLKEETYPSGLTIENMYNQRGFLTQVNNKQTSQPVWELLDVNSKGQPLELSLGNGLHTYREYDAYGYLYVLKTGTSETTDFVQHYTYGFTPEWGRPASRFNYFGNQEIFDYDALNRLTSVNILNNHPEDLIMHYSPNGNISLKTGLGNYYYENSQPHAVTKVDNNSMLISQIRQDVTYTPFNKVSTITEGDNQLLFSYGTASQRVKTEYYNLQLLQKTKYFAGNYEQEIIDGNIRELHYIAGPMGLAAIYVKQGGNDTMYYTHTDHLGSITEITNNTGTLLQRMQYDAWGKRELLVSNTGNNAFLFDRGYTGHEHLDQFALINMNGRLYDPMLGRMLSPDNFAQNSTQGLNRYSYAMNNPMVYTDPSGEFLFPLVVFMLVVAYEHFFTNNTPSQGFYVGATAALIAATAGFGNLIYTSGIAYAGTASIIGGSAAFSAGQFILTGGKSDVGFSFGFGSYDMTSNEFGYLGKEDNSFLENLSYGMGTVANVSDILAGFNPTTLENRIEDNPPNRDFRDNPTPEQRKIDWASHEQLSDPITGKPVIDWGPTESGVTPNEWGHGKLLTKTLGKPIKVNGVNRGTLDKYVGWLEGTDYNTYFNNCSQAAARGLTLSGVPVIGFHPWVLQASLYSRSIGIRPSLFLWEYNNYYHY